MLASFCVFIFFLTACGEQQLTDLRLSGRTMGTTYHITLVNVVESRQTSLQSGIDEVLEGVNQRMSTYINTSELSQLNQAASGKVLNVSSELMAVLQVAQQVHQRSEGAFDITVGPLVNLWGFGPDFRTDQIPSAEAIAERLAWVDGAAVQLKSNTLVKDKAVRMDLSAVAKGYAVDKVAEFLLAEGINHFLVEVGGEMRLSGLNPKGKRWRVGIERPVSDQYGAVQEILSVSDKAVATSGDYRNFFEYEGVRYSHIVDPSTGWPVKQTVASVTVVLDSCAEADAWATAMTVLGYDRGIKIAKQYNLPVMFILRNGDEFVRVANPAYEALDL